MTTGTVAASTVPAANGTAGTGRAAGIPAALTPGGAQAVFRAALDALARPGTVKRLPSAADEPLAGHVPAALLPLLALADLSTPACVVDGAPGRGADDTADRAPVASEAPAAAGPDGPSGPDGPDGPSGRTHWEEIVRVATNAPRAPLETARLVAALRPLSAGELGRLRTGTAAAPEDGALACLAVSGIAIAADAGTGADRAAEDTAAGEDTGEDASGAEDGSVTAEDDAVTPEDGSVTPEDDAVTAEDDAVTPEDDAVTGGAAGAGRESVRDEDADGIDGDAGRRLLLRLSGPGVPGTRAIIVTGLPAGFAAARERLVAGFPAGADMLLIAPDGAMAGLPRTTAVREEAL